MSPEVLIGSASCAALITGIVTIITRIMDRHAKKKDDKSKSIDERMGKVEDRMTKMESTMEVLMAGVRSLLYSQIKDKAREAIARGYISTDDLEDLVRKHELYHGPFEGNGYLDALMDKVRGLPVHE